MDRPVGLDAWHDLPFVPFSGLKGVIAGRYGNVRQDRILNDERVKRFGSPDHVDSMGRRQPGKPSDLIVGDGDLLCFPLLLDDGRLVRIFPALNLARFLGLLGETPARSLNLPDEDRFSGSVKGASLPGSPTRQYADPGAPTTSLMAQLLGRDPGLFVIAGSAVSRALWRRAGDGRTLTALESSRKRVKAHSLRRIEAVPDGTVFLSYLTNVGSCEPPFLIDSQVQLGAWEATGCGFVLVEIVSQAPIPGIAVSPETEETAPARRPAHVLMREAFEAVEGIRDQPEAMTVRSILMEFGPRSRTQGLPRTLAFCLAKARLAAPPDDQLGPAALGYRWFLRTLFPVHRPDLLTYVADVISGHVISPPDTEAFSTWLRRYGEVLPPVRKGSDVP